MQTIVPKAMENIQTMKCSHNWTKEKIELELGKAFAAVIVEIPMQTMFDFETAYKILNSLH